jgi:stage V sporulation protein D (sporulation-specific penicillin-binding protein)
MAFVILMIAFSAIIIRLAYVQLVNGEELQAKAESLRTRELSVAAKRGTIYDRNGKKLAISLSADSIYAAPTEVLASGEADATAEKLASILGMDKETILAKITKNSSFEWIKRKVDFAKSQEIEDADMPGIKIIEETQRFYPKGSLAAHILGFAGIDNQGLEGLEIAKDDVLSGTAGSIVTEYDAKGIEIPQAVKEYNPPTDGNSIVLTIDETIQYFAERELDNLMTSEYPPASASILIMNPKTGEILAMANRPTYDPNDYQNYDNSTRRNKAVVDTYEPGSTFKIITASTAYDSGVVSLSDHFYCKGYYSIGSKRIKCWRSYRPHGDQIFAQTMQNSCNPSLVQVGLRIEAKEEGLFYDYIRNFGYGKPTGVELAGEAAGIMIPEEKLSDLNIGTISIGQGISVTPLQMVSAVSAVVNGGNLLKPQIIKRIVDNDGNVIRDFQVKEVRRVISEDSSSVMRDILESVVAEGTGRQAYVEGYRVGGKTGTAQKAGKGGYLPGKYVASFIGVAPCDDPQITVLVMIDEPSGPLYQGGQVAAPVAKVVIEDTLRYLGVVSQLSNLEDNKIRGNTVAKKIAVPNVINLTAEEAEKVLAIAGLTSEIKDGSNIVTSQTPAGSTMVETGSRVILRTGNTTVGGTDQITMPDLTGKRVREVAELLGAMGLKLKSSGTGIATEQLPIPGTKVKRGDIVEVIFNPETESVETSGP